MDWTDYFMGFATHAAKKSKGTTKVGAVLVGPGNEIRLTGYNGPARGVQDTEERRERPMKYLFDSHAESNVVAFAAREGIKTKGCYLYVTHYPCSKCADMIIQSGITCVFISDGETKMPKEEFDTAKIKFKEAEVSVYNIGDFQ